MRVPAPCQYAHKLAQLVGMHLHGDPSGVLREKLWYLWDSTNSLHLTPLLIALPFQSNLSSSTAGQPSNHLSLSYRIHQQLRFSYSKLFTPVILCFYKSSPNLFSMLLYSLAFSQLWAGILCSSLSFIIWDRFCASDSDGLLLSKFSVYMYS